jgi:CheY-like chemotaxis protein
MRGKRVLIVDDEAPLRFLLSKQLGRAGFETVTAGNGEAALATVASGPFDAIVLDVVMPGMDGFEVCRRLKADVRSADTPIIFLSASCSGEFRRRAFRVGAADFLAKPYQIDQLAVYIQAALRRAAAQGATTRPAPGHVVAVIGAPGGQRASGTAAVAIRLAETAALQGPGPAMLIDLELPAGSIGARLQLSGGPNMRVFLQESDAPVSAESIGRVAQRYHAALEVMPAPFSPSPLWQPDPTPQRLADALDLLKEQGYYVVVHLGSVVDELTLTAMRRAETIYAASGGEALDEYEALLDAITAEGIAGEQILPTQSEAEALPAGRPASSTPSWAQWEPMTAQLAPA